MHVSRNTRLYAHEHMMLVRLKAATLPHLADQSAGACGELPPCHLLFFIVT